MLLSELLKGYCSVKELKSEMAQQRVDFEAAIARQQKTTEALLSRLDEQKALIQKVNDRLEMRKLNAEILISDL